MFLSRMRQYEVRIRGWGSAGCSSVLSDALDELGLNRPWRPALSLTGIDGMPSLESAGNVLRPHTAVKLSLRLPPTLDGKAAGDVLKDVLLRDPPNGAQVSLELEKASTGWNAPAMSPWLEKAIDAASKEFYGRPAMDMGEGGSLPLMEIGRAQVGTPVNNEKFHRCHLL